MPVITTDQAPAAKPVAKNLTLTTAWQTLVEAPGYVVPIVGFNTGTRAARGAIEFSSPLLIANVDNTAHTFSVRIVRSTPSGTFVIANELVVEANDVLAFPLNGQFLVREVGASSGDSIEVTADSNGVLTATISYTEGQAEEDDVA